LLEETTFLLASLTCHSEVTVSEKKMPYIEGFVPRINTSPKPTIFTNNTIVTLYSKTFNDFCSVTNTVPSHLSNSITANKLFLNLGITYIQADFFYDLVVFLRKWTEFKKIYIKQEIVEYMG